MAREVAKLPKSLQTLLDAITEGLVLHSDAFEKDVVTGIVLTGRFERGVWEMVTQPQTSTKALRENRKR